MMKYIFILAILLSPVLSRSQGAVDGFLQEKGVADFAFAATGVFATNYQTTNDNFSIGLGQGIVSGYVKYGLTRHIGIIGSLPVINGRLQDGLAMISFGTDRIKLGKYGLTLITAVGHSGPLSNYPTEAASSIGQRAVVMPFRLLAQLRMPKNWFVNLRGGYNSVLDPPPQFLSLFGKDCTLQRQDVL